VEVKRRKTKSHKMGHHDFRSSLNILRVIKGRKIQGVGHVTHMGEITNAHKILALKPAGRRPTWRTEVHSTWEGVIKFQSKGTKCKIVDVIEIAYCRLNLQAYASIIISLWVQ
jgi:hypothetical protein